MPATARPIKQRIAHAQSKHDLLLPTEESGV
jgi:hypothetical protein